MAIFLETSDAYRLLQRELPEGVYPDGSPTGSYSAASIYSKSELVGDAYANMEVIYDNLFPQTADEQQVAWEIKVFGYELDGSLTLQERRDKVLGKLRHKAGITIAEMIYIVQFVIGTDKDVAIGEWQNASGSWVIGVSELGVTTIFGNSSLLKWAANLWPGVSDLCTLTAEDIGITDAEFAAAQEAAYAYSVLIYSYTPTAQELSQIDLLLTNGEPARSTHYIYSGLDPAYHI